jgi:hypothetical protein
MKAEHVAVGTARVDCPEDSPQGDMSGSEGVNDRGENLKLES